jgi:hypothetical protein
VGEIAAKAVGQETTRQQYGHVAAFARVWKSDRLQEQRFGQ